MHMCSATLQSRVSIPTQPNVTAAMLQQTSCWSDKPSKKCIEQLTLLLDLSTEYIHND